MGHSWPSIFIFVKNVFLQPDSIGVVNHTLLTLSPKGNDPCEAVNGIYKVTTKVVANRIKKLLPSVYIIEKIYMHVCITKISIIKKVIL